MAAAHHMRSGGEFSTSGMVACWAKSFSDFRVLWSLDFQNREAQSIPSSSLALIIPSLLNSKWVSPCF